MNKYKYKNLLFFGTLQFCGNLTEYFLENCEKLVVYYVMPRHDTAQNMVRVFKKGVLKHERKFYSPSNIVLCYALLYINFVRILFWHFNKNETFFVFSGHPLFSFLKSLLTKFRKYEIVYFVGDYYPGTSLLNTFYRVVFSHYHKRSKYRIYLSDRLNKVINGKIINTKTMKTVMWGIDPIRTTSAKRVGRQIKLCFVGVLRESQGIELLLQTMKEYAPISLKLLGSSTSSLEKKYASYIKRHKLQKRVFFPRKSFYGQQLQREMAGCHIGIALYDTGPQNGTYYADPAKVKTYTQYNLPVIMTDAAQVTDYISKFRAGIIVASDIASVKRAIDTIVGNYNAYLRGVSAFNKYFNYRTYYNDKFQFLEK